MARNSKNFGTDRKLTRTALVSRALQYKRAGFSEAEILRKIPQYQEYSNPLQTLKNDLRKALNEAVTVQSRQLVTLQYLRYERLLRAVFVAAMNGDIDAHKQALATIKQQSELMKLNQTTHDDGGEVDKWLDDMLGEETMDDELDEEIFDDSGE